MSKYSKAVQPIMSTLSGFMGPGTQASISSTLKHAAAGAGVGAVGGGILGAMDNNESFVGGALKGGVLGGTIGAGVGGWLNRGNFDTLRSPVQAKNFRNLQMGGGLKNQVTSQFGGKRSPFAPDSSGGFFSPITAPTMR
jgi:hypothetical protein